MAAPAQPRQPYTQTLTKLKKADLTRLCVDLRLPSVGTALDLRNWLKDHLNTHRDTIYRNPRYKRLYPQHRRPNQPPPPSPEPTDSISTRASSPGLSYQSPSPVTSEDLWQGIEDQPDQQDVPEHPPMQPPQLFLPQGPLTPQHSPPNSVAATRNSIPPSEIQQVVGRE